MKQVVAEWFWNKTPPRSDRDGYYAVKKLDWVANYALSWSLAGRTYIPLGWGDAPPEIEDQFRSTNILLAGGPMDGAELVHNSF